MDSKKARRIILFVSGFFLLLDQIIKWAFLNSASNAFLNSGIAFGLPMSNKTTILLTSIMIIIIVYLAIKEKSSLNFFAWTIVLSGAISNLSDRLFRKHVVDYIYIYNGVFNIADVLIFLGVFVFIFSLLRNKYVSKA